MKTPKFLMIISTMIFGMAIMAGVAVVAIILISNKGDDAAGTQALQVSTETPVQESNNPGFVYLSQNQTHTLLRVSLADGSSQEVSLDEPTDNSVWVGNLSFSDDGLLVAYCAQDRISDELANYRLVIRDIEAEETIRESGFGAVDGCQVSAFSEDATEVAVGIVYNTPAMGIVNHPNQPDWELQINSVYDAGITHILREGDANAPDYESMTEDFWFSEGISAMTRAVYFSDTEILFTAFPYIGRDGPLKIPAHRWNLQTGEINPVEGLTQLGADYLPETGETVYAEVDEAFPAAQPVGPMPLANTIRINDNGDIRTIYRNSEYVIATTGFINGGRQIAAMLIGAWDENNPGEIAASRYEIINRDGSLGQVSSNFFNYNQMVGTADGMVLLSLIELGIEGHEYQLVHYVDGEMRTIWSAASDRNQSYDFVWASPMPVADGLAIFAIVN